MHREIGKIEKIVVGRGGYQDAMFGVSISLSGKGWGTGDWKGTWANCMSEGKDSKWRDEQRDFYGKTFLWLDALCDEAKVTNVNDLVGKPIEATFSGPCGKLLSWRILTEVL